MTPREKEIALEAAGRSSEPLEHARKMVEAEAFLSGDTPPFVVWTKTLGNATFARRDGMSHAEKAAWHEAQAAVERERAEHSKAFIEQGRQGDL
jgi:hypothetical protein|tara:strand:- start:704 stop:985 length:282 start_codon:yes stop_codon:yes gene_type:complete